MKILGIGVDIIKNKRITKSIKNKKFLQRIYNKEEIIFFKKEKKEIIFMQKDLLQKNLFLKH